jgi:hypothetical protein
VTSDDRLEDHLAAGLADLAGSGARPDVNAILARSFRTRQRPARFPFQRSDLPSAAPGAAAGDLAGRLTRIMPILRYAAVAVIALALGLVAPPFLGSPAPSQRAASPSPSAPVDPASWVSGTIALANSCIDPKTQIRKGGGLISRGYRCEPQVWTTDDPRLSGTGAVTWNFDTYDTDQGKATLNVATTEIHNDGGDWQCTSSPIWTKGPVIPGAQLDPEALDCVGSGGYEGLIAVIHVDLATTPYPIKGVILSGSLPPAP